MNTILKNKKITSLMNILKISLYVLFFILNELLLYQIPKIYIFPVTKTGVIKKIKHLVLRARNSNK